jgi:nucleoside-diphosphate-sugar epimerase
MASTRGRLVRLDAPLDDSPGRRFHPRVRPVHLITGATGFVGAALCLELLRSSDAELVAVVRAQPSLDPTTRLRRELAAAARLYGAEPLLGQLERCHAIAGDVLEPGCGITTTLDFDVAQVWHGAASLQFEDRHHENIHATNVEGTRRVLALAEIVGAGTFNYVSTAYVAGRSTGLIGETLAHAEPNNHYERSKLAAEQLVAASPLRTRILRPSIVVGHSRTRAATNFSGFYGFLRQLVQFRGMMERTQRGLLERTPIRMRVDADVPLDLVCVDVVAREAVAIALRDASEGVYHLTNPGSPTVGETVRTCFALAGLREPIFVEDRNELTWLDERFDRRLDFYGSYLVGHKRFDRTRAAAALRDATELDHPTLDHPALDLAALGRWYLDELGRTRAQLPVAR